MPTSQLLAVRIAICPLARIADQGRDVADQPVDAVRLRQAQGRPSILHLDYNPYNVAVEGDRISGLLDWTNARIGDPRADLARDLDEPLALRDLFSTGLSG